MPLRLTVASSPDLLADALADELARPLPDPFQTEVVAVPGDGVRAWLSERLGRRLGVSRPNPDAGGAPDGIVANIDVVFPATLIRRALGLPDHESAWEVGRLTWAVHHVLHERGAEIDVPAPARASGPVGDALTGGEFGGAPVGNPPVDAVRCRSIADLLDRYALHRPSMVRRWEAGTDVDAGGRPLPEHLRWQPRLWRALCDLLGHPSGPAELADAANRLRLGRLEPDLPERAFLVGLASMAPPHLMVLSALASRIDVHVLAPVWSPTVWDRILATARTNPSVPPIERTVDPCASAAAHRLGAIWGRAPRESQHLLALTAVESGARIEVLDQRGPAHHDDDGASAGTSRSLLHLLQADLRADRDPPGAPAVDAAERRAVLSPDDRSIEWHRCHGPARQVEVLRDAVVRLLEERETDGSPRFEPRDIAVLCPDPSVYAPLVEAAFDGDPEHGIPAVNVRVADRSLREDTPLLQVTAALLDLLDGRFRASDVEAFAAMPPVRNRFGLEPEHLGLLADWVRQTSIRWGVDADSRRRFDVPTDVDRHTWQAGLDQVVVGAVMADPNLAPAGFVVGFGPGYTVPLPDVEGDDVEVLGSIADLVDELHVAADRLAGPLPVAAWCAALAESVRALCALDDADAWQWRQFDRLLTDLTDEAVVAGRPSPIPVPAGELATLLAARLVGRPGRARFGTGAVTVSSLTAQRAVPHRVVCLLGVDGDLGAGMVRADDLTALAPCVGDRDPRAELRAQLLDALLGASDRLVITSTGRDLRTNALIPPSVPLAELADLVDATVRPPSGSGDRASRLLITDHPRHAWSERNFLPGALGVEGPWSFDAAAARAAGARRSTRSAASFLPTPLPAELPGDLTLDAVRTALQNPVQTLLADRLGIAVREGRELGDDLIPLTLDPLVGYELRDDQLGARMAPDSAWDETATAAWSDLKRRAGRVPPMGFGDTVLAKVGGDVDGIVTLAREACGESWNNASADVPIDVDLGGRRLTGVVAGVRGDQLVEIRASTLKAKHRLAAWLRLLVLAAVQPDESWSAVVIGRRSDKAVAEHLRIRDRAAALAALDIVVDLHDRARRTLIPMLPETTWAVHRDGLWSGDGEWERYNGFGERDDRWVRFACGRLDYVDLVAEPPLADEAGDRWSSAPSRLQRWSDRLWGAFDASVDTAAPGAGDDD